MRAHTLLLNTFTRALMICGLLLSACAHQEGGISDADFLDGDNSAYGESENFEISGESSEAGEDFVTVDDGSDALGLPSEGELTNAEVDLAEDAEEGAFSDPVDSAENFADAETSDQPQFIVDNAEASPLPEMEATEPQLVMDTPAADQTIAMDTMDFGTQPQLESDPAIQPEASQSEVSQPVKSQPKPRVVLTTPKAPTQPVSKNGELLNRYYVLRESDTPGDLSELFYGSPSRSEEISQWNKDSQWKAGQFVYYVSPAQPADGEMRSFYEERGMVAQEYVVRKGDSLGQIAKDQYGDANSWKEIGLVNQMKKPDDLAPGMRLVLFPSDLSSYAYKQEEAPQKTASLDKEINSLESEISALEREINTQVAAQDQVNPNREEPLIQSMDGEKLTSQERPEKLASVEVSSFFQRNISFLLAIGVGLLVALFWIVFRKPKDSSTDF